VPRWLDAGVLVSIFKIGVTSESGPKFTEKLLYLCGE